VLTALHQIAQAVIKPGSKIVKMNKFSLFLLAFCCFLYVSVSHQQQFIPRRFPLPFYNNFYYDSPQLAENNWMMRQSPLLGVRNNYIQPNYHHSSQNPSFNHQMLMVQILLFQNNVGVCFLCERLDAQ
jgi:hypothetical protein